MQHVVCPQPWFARLVQDLASHPGRPILARFGIQRVRDDIRWLLRDPGGGFESRPPNVPDALFEIHGHDQDVAPALTLSSTAVGRLDLGHGRLSGHLGGVALMDGVLRPLDKMVLIGSGMYRILAHGEGHRGSMLASRVFPPSLLSDAWSRTIGALGGEDIWHRLVRLRVGVIGCSRSGSLAAVALARLGVRDLTLIDPDIVEAHHLGEMEAVSESDIGRPKALAVANQVRRILGQSAPFVNPIVADLAQPPARIAARACDVLFLCVDNDAARLLAAILGSLYHKVLVDIGTGIHFIEETAGPLGPRARGSRPRARVMGADVRMILPGNGCLLCRGNLAHYAQAVDELCNQPRRRSLPTDGWRTQRAGSLRSLNELAVASGIQMFQDLVVERIQSSTWLRLEIHEVGRLTVRYPEVVPSTGNLARCPLCARSGLGDLALNAAVSLAFSATLG
jgi:hypothetical protein